MSHFVKLDLAQSRHDVQITNALIKQSKHNAAETLVVLEDISRVTKAVTDLLQMFNLTAELVAFAAAALIAFFFSHRLYTIL